MNSELLKSIIKIEDGPVEVTISMGWKPIATLEEQNGRWFITVGGNDFGKTLGYSSKEKAFEEMIYTITH